MPDSAPYFESINLRIIEIHKMIAERERLARIVDSLAAQIETQREVVERLSAEREREKADVVALETLSPRSILYRLLGQHESQLSREIEEWLAAKLSVTDALTKLGVLQARHANLQTDLLELSNCDSELGWLSAERDRLIAQADAATGGRLVQLSFALAPLQARQKELNEALSAGEAALVSMRRVQGHLANGRDNSGKWITAQQSYKPQALRKTPSLFDRRDGPSHYRLPVRDAVKESESLGRLLVQFEQELYDLPEYALFGHWPTPAFQQGHVGTGEPFAARYQHRLDEWQQHVDLLLRFVTENVKRLQLASAENRRQVNRLVQQMETIEKELFSAENFR